MANEDRFHLYVYQVGDNRDGDLPSHRLGTGVEIRSAQSRRNYVRVVGSIPFVPLQVDYIDSVCLIDLGQRPDAVPTPRVEEKKDWSPYAVTTPLFTSGNASTVSGTCGEITIYDMVSTPSPSTIHDDVWAVYTISSNASCKSISSGCSLVRDPGMERDVPNLARPDQVTSPKNMGAVYRRTSERPNEGEKDNTYISFCSVMEKLLSATITSDSDPTYLHLGLRRTDLLARRPGVSSPPAMRTRYQYLPRDRHLGYDFEISMLRNTRRRVAHLPDKCVNEGNNFGCLPHFLRYIVLARPYATCPSDSVTPTDQATGPKQP
ncbi:hypothetical protein F5141DRAFT_1067237 [Pisolithus sp. B1]|nr:hypothetical protein F5141DRAFT_1067237 [Pisolithus sp. B1]